MSRRGFALKGGIVATGASVMGSSLITEPTQGLFSLSLWYYYIIYGFSFSEFG